MRRYPNAAEGLRLMFIAQIVIIVGTVLMLVPVVGIIVGLVGGIVNLLGLYKAQADDNGYQMAFYVSIAVVVVGVLRGIAGEGVLSMLLNIASIFLSLAVVYYVCITTSNLLHSIGEETLADKGVTVWRIYLAVGIVSIVCSVLLFVPVLNVLAMAVSVVAAIAQLVGYILYLIFLNGSSKAL